MNFNFDTIENFDDHINKSIPDYDILFNHIVSFSTNFIKNNSIVYDIGSSTGKLIDGIKAENNDVNFSIYGIEKSKSLSNSHKDIIVENALNCELENNSAFITSVFFLQFLSLDERIQMIQKIYNSLQKGGCLILCEKIFLENGFFQDLFTFNYYDYKKRSFSEKEILKKQKDLRYIMQPLTEKENLYYLKNAGFRKIESFWQSLNFKGWIIIK